LYMYNVVPLRTYMYSGTVVNPFMAGGTPVYQLRFPVANKRQKETKKREGLCLRVDMSTMLFMGK
jgi:hypothetical protein